MTPTLSQCYVVFPTDDRKRPMVVLADASVFGYLEIQREGLKPAIGWHALRKAAGEGLNQAVFAHRVVLVADPADTWMWIAVVDRAALNVDLLREIRDQVGSGTGVVCPLDYVQPLLDRCRAVVDGNAEADLDLRDRPRDGLILVDEFQEVVSEVSEGESTVPFAPMEGLLSRDVVKARWKARGAGLGWGRP